MEKVVAIIGQKIKTLRSKRGLTLDEVARLSGCTPGFISQIEHNKAVPSITTLHAIAAALGVPVADFFPGVVNQSKVVRHDAQESFQLEGSAISYALLSTKFPHSGLAGFLMTVKPVDQALPTDEFRAHVGEEFYYMIEGVIRFWVGDGFYDLHPGNSMHFKSTTRHRLENLGQKDVVLLGLITPSIF
jgi:transcriptional regulator with XRE-family HTH domain